MKAALSGPAGVVLTPGKMCETRSGNLAHTVGRTLLKKGRPMLVEHICGFYLQHDLKGRVLTPGFGAEYDIVHVLPMEE